MFYAMINLQERIAAFSALGTAIRNFRESELEQIYRKSAAHNPWFTKENVLNALDGVLHYLDKKALEDWVEKYNFPEKPAKVIGVVMAGNIPLVGFHDFLSVLISGNSVKAKLSHQDPFLLPYLANILIELAPDFKSQIEFVERVTDVDAIIATGSDNSSRYFNYYFSKYPHIIRKNRTSIGIINGNETKEELHALGRDIFQYYGLGCRNVSKLFVPADYNFNAFFEAIQPYETISENHKYANNYDYNKSIYLVNGVEHLDNGFLLLTQSQSLVSPISVLYYETYKNPEDLSGRIQQMKENLQCIVSQRGGYPGSFNFGNAQEPELWDYADGVDVMRFLEGL
jgi:hypothetical protein